MPRFASNLSFNPLEPLKPISSASASSSSTLISSKSELNEIKILATQPSKTLLQQQQPDVIPEVEFDWNSSGLVNPLDGELKSFNFIRK